MASLAYLNCCVFIHVVCVCMCNNKSIFFDVIFPLLPFYRRRTFLCVSTNHIQSIACKDEVDVNTHSPIFYWIGREFHLPMMIIMKMMLLPCFTFRRRRRRLLLLIIIIVVVDVVFFYGVCLFFLLFLFFKPTDKESISSAYKCGCSVYVLISFQPQSRKLSSMTVILT